MKDWKDEARAILDAWAQYFEPKEYYANMEEAIAAALSAAYEKGVEDAAKVVEDLYPEAQPYVAFELDDIRADAASSIRALKSAAKEGNR